jgi:CHRD domain
MNLIPSKLLRQSILTAILAWTSTAPMIASAADTATFSATLSGAAEVPANTSAGTGTLDATLDKGSNTLTWKATFVGLTGPATMAHFHGPAMPGANAGVVVPFASAVSPLEGKATLTPAQAADLLAGKWYANVHTAANPGGEIRGQLMLK